MVGEDEGITSVSGSLAGVSVAPMPSTGSFSTVGIENTGDINGDGNDTFGDRVGASPVGDCVGKSVGRVVHEREGATLGPMETGDGSTGGAACSVAGFIVGRGAGVGEERAWNSFVPLRRLRINVDAKMIAMPTSKTKTM